MVLGDRKLATYLPEKLSQEKEYSNPSCELESRHFK